MGTRADFYVGRGPEAEWLGSIAWDGYPSGIDAPVLACTTEQEWRDSVSAFLKDRKDRTLPEDGWPWPWEDSATTDYAYALDLGKVWGSAFGSEWFDATQEEPENLAEKAAVFPNMKDRKQRAKFGPHSGIILFQAGGE